MVQNYLERRKIKIQKLVDKMTENTEEGLSQGLLVEYAREHLFMLFNNSGDDYLQDAWKYYMEGE